MEVKQSLDYMIEKKHAIGSFILPLEVNYLRPDFKCSTRASVIFHYLRPDFEGKGHL